MSNLATKEDMTQGARKYLRNIVIASSNLIDIVNDILDFSKLEAGKLEIAEEPFSVADALEVAENVMRISAEQKDLTFTVDPRRTSLPPVWRCEPVESGADQPHRKRHQVHAGRRCNVKASMERPA